MSDPKTQTYRGYCPTCGPDQVLSTDTRCATVERCFSCGVDVNDPKTRRPASVVRSEATGWDEAPAWSETPFDARVVTDAPPDRVAVQVGPRELVVRVSKAQRRRARQAQLRVARFTGGVA